MFRISVAVCLSLSIAAQAVAQSVASQSTLKTNVPSHKEDFEGAFVPVVKTPGSVSSVVGNIPAGWTEDSSWSGANVKINYTKFASGTFAGKGALRIKVDDVKSGLRNCVSTISRSTKRHS
jgi:hypothetical protein